MTRQLRLPTLLLYLVVFSPITVLSFQSIKPFLINDVTRSDTTARLIASTIVKVTTTTKSSLLRSVSVSEDNTDTDTDNDDDHSHPYEYDLAVIGAGPVGVQAAIQAAMLSSPSSSSSSSSSSSLDNPVQKKMKVVLIDAPRASGKLMNEETNEDLSIGGPTGLFSKAIRDTAKRIKVSTLRGMGLREDSVWNEIISSCAELASFNAQDMRRQLEYAGVTLVEGYAKFNDSGGSHQLVISNDKIWYDGKIEKTTTTISADKILLATGSRPFRPVGIPFDGVRVFDSDSINGLNFLPKSVVITGSGIVAIEYAKIFSNLGCDDVTLLIRDKSPRNALMKIGLDKDIAATLVADLIRSGIKIERACEVGEIVVPTSSATAVAKNKNNQNYIVPLTIGLKMKGGKIDRPLNSVREIKCDAYVAAVGRIPNTDNLNLKAAGIEIDDYGGISVDTLLRANGPKDRNVYGAGDVLGRPFLASTGVAQGAAAIKNMFQISSTGENDYSAITSNLISACAPDDESCNLEEYLLSKAAACDPTTLTANPFAFPVGVWSSPEASYYGLSTKQAEEMGIDAGEGIALYAQCLRGLVFSPNGLLKLVFQKSTGRIVGVHICGEDACELIHYGMEIIKSRRTITDVANGMYSAVTFHEMYRIAALSCMDPKAARKSRSAAGKALTERRRRENSK
mmetsp:Transcript_15175/g.17044  ORF Transcript_15175/g.17044 Transcript_15175/m.17044 type:complete len:681 (-) Transcript_15175:105-2147(-)